MADAVIKWLSGPVIRAGTREPFHVNEAVLVGPDALLGEVIQLGSDHLVAQVYEDTTGLKPGDAVAGTGQALAVRLGPGLLGKIFDGLLRPLHLMSGDFVHAGMRADSNVRFFFQPLVKNGDVVRGGMRLGRIETDGPPECCLIPPGYRGRIESIVAQGEYAVTEPLCRVIEPEHGLQEICASHYWPVRRARPVQSRLQPTEPLVTGQRIMDTLFPVARGSKACLPGGFGTGKTILQESLAKSCDADVIVYVGCGERGNEMAEVLNEFPELEDPSTGRPLMERTVIIANTSNMPVAAREASIYTGIAVAEYFRDQGLDVALMADSTTRWAEALREISGRLGELPGESGYPAYLSSRLAEFYERAAHVETLAGETGSVTIIGAVSPPAGDFSEPVTSQTKRYVRAFWSLDKDRAQERFFPAIHPLESYSEDVEALEHWWQVEGNPDWVKHRRRVLTLLEDRARLERMARIIGKDALPPRQQLTLLCADLVNEGFLRQSAFSPVDRYCSPARQTALLKLILHFIDRAEAALDEGVELDRIESLPIFRQLQRAAEEIPEAKQERFRMLGRKLDVELDQITQVRAHAS